MSSQSENPGEQKNGEEGKEGQVLSDRGRSRNPGGKKVRQDKVLIRMIKRGDNPSPKGGSQLAGGPLGAK